MLRISGVFAVLPKRRNGLKSHHFWLAYLTIIIAGMVLIDQKPTHGHMIFPAKAECRYGPENAAIFEVAIKEQPLTTSDTACHSRKNLRREIYFHRLSIPHGWTQPHGALKIYGIARTDP